MKRETKNRLFMWGYAFCLLVASIMICDCAGNKSAKNANSNHSDLPLAEYSLTPDSFPFRFYVSDQADFSARKTTDGEYFCDVDYPSLKAHLYCTWHSINPSRFPLMAEEGHKMAYQHLLVATAIKENLYANDSLKVYGILYDIEGNAATPLQVVLTDSVSYFFNASLYFNVTPNADSIAPILEYVRKDVRRMMETYINNQ